MKKFKVGVLKRVILPAAFLILIGSSLTCASPQAKSAKKANCLIITIDTLRADRLSAFGSTTVSTPNIDRLAAGGVKFTRCFAHTVTTLPSHTNIFLGLLPPAHGVHDNANFVVPGGLPTLPEIFQQSGYETAAFIGAYPLDRRFGLDRGFARYDDDYGPQDFSRPIFVERPAEEVVDRALDWLKTASRPWFLWIHCFDPHYPYEPPEPFRSSYKDHPYDGEVAYVDRELGRLFSYLEQNGLTDRTLIIITSDHGESLGEHGEKTHGYLAYNSTLHVPLIIQAPGFKGGRSEATVVSHLDIFPTVCELLGLKKPAGLQGRSLLPALRGKKLGPEKVYFESLYPYFSRGWAPITGYIDFPIKFMDSPQPELYDLEKDFQERRNLAPGRDLRKEREQLAALIKAAGSPEAVRARVSPSRESLERLRSLGYLGGGSWPPKQQFQPSDDVKSFLPFENRAEEALSLFRSAGRVQEAINLLQANLQEKEDHDLSYNYLSSIYLERGQYREALAVLRRGRDRLPGNYTIFLAYVSTLLELGDYQEVARLTGEVESFPQAGNDPEIWNSLGAALINLGRYEEALEKLDKALSIDPDFPAALSNQGFALLMIARLKSDRQLLEKSMDRFKEALARNRNYAQAYNGLGAAYKSAGNTEAAIQCWLQALQLAPDLSQVLYNLGFAYLEKGEKARALEYLLKYKEKVYQFLTPAEKQELDELIRRAR
ncbi:MAG: sulfatase-like hydrolase/transferase [Candidatus Saccharicenans sp.]|uniref:sulfatase-like hydrolase/transferase n=1 Tax=Candidatus Saccharicenans sp. TaxID=2819258 RepID=UPI00404B10BD